MTQWQLYIDGLYYSGIQNVDIINTIAGTQKFEIILSDVENLNNINHFADVEIWSPTDDPPGGLIFDGTDDFIALASTLEMDSDDWAVSWWMKRSANNHENIFSYIISGGISGRIDVDDTHHDRITFESYTNGTASGYVATGIDTADGSWHHYVLDFNSTNTILYVDGSQAGTTIKNTDTHTFDIKYIGHQQQWYGDWFTGSLADIKIFDESIDADEVSNLYNGKNTITCKAYYTLSQSSAEDDAIYDRRELSHGTSYTGATTKGALTVDTSPLDQFIAFKGRIDLLLPDYDSDTLSISGRDYVGELLSRAVVESYGDGGGAAPAGSDKLRSYMVNDIILKYGTSMTRRNIDDSPVGTEIEYLFKTSAWDAVIKCGKDDGYRFFVDTDKDFHYHVKGWRESGETIESGVDDILTYNIVESGSNVVNMVTIFGYDDGTSQIRVMAEDLDSQAYYGIINEKRIVDLSIMTEDDAIDFAYNYLSDHAYVLEIIEIELLGREMLNPGDLITLKIPRLNIDGKYLIVDKLLKYPNNTTIIKVAMYVKHLEGMIGDMVEKILMLERYFMEEGSAVLKLHRVNEAILYTDRVVLEKRASDDSFKVGVTGWSTIGETAIGGRGGEWTEVYSSSW